jgi:helicase
MIVIRQGNKRHEFELYRKTNEKVKKYNLILAETAKGFRPQKLRIGDTLLQPNSIIPVLRDEEIFMAEKCGEMEKMLDDFGVSHEKIDLCRFCLIEGKINTMKRGYRFHGEQICEECAKKEIFREMRYRNIQSDDAIVKVLRRVRDVDKILRIFDPRSGLDPEVTKFDEIEAHSFEGKNIDELKIPQFLKKNLKKRGITKLFPTQSRAIDNGLLEDEDLLIVSATASGKTLVGEIAGIPKVAKGKKLLFLVPLVALANQKYEEFKRNYRFGVAIRVGLSRIYTGESFHLDTAIDADIIVGTYEGIDFLLRAGKDLGEIGTIVIDEVHMLDEEERGPRLDGLIARLRTHHPNAQFIGLSATIGNAAELAADLALRPVIYDQRPIPLERHLVFTQEDAKKDVLQKIVKREWNTLSKKGYHGQSIIFTYSRRQCNELATYLQRRGIKARSYHAGLSYHERKRTEDAFWNQQIHCVVTTAALSAGVDFPSSQVIFASLQMGIEVLKVREFHQMLGRAGRPDYHEKGKVYILIDPLREYRDTSEDEVAFHLLQSQEEDVEVRYTQEMELEILLANICSSPANLTELNNAMLYPLDMKKREILEKKNLIKNNKATPYGRAVSVSFLSIEEAEHIRKHLNGDLLDLVVSLERYENVYITNALRSTLEVQSTRLFSGEVLEAVTQPKQLKMVEPLLTEFFACECKEYPYCDCSVKKISRKIIEYRMKGYSPQGIAKAFLRYHLVTYSGDIFSYLDSIVHIMEACERIARIFNKKRLKEIQNIKKRIEKGKS